MRPKLKGKNYIFVPSIILTIFGGFGVFGNLINVFSYQGFYTYVVLLLISGLTLFIGIYGIINANIQEKAHNFIHIGIAYFLICVIEMIMGIINLRNIDTVSEFSDLELDPAFYDVFSNFLSVFIVMIVALSFIFALTFSTLFIVGAQLNKNTVIPPQYPQYPQDPQNPQGGRDQRWTY